MLFNFLLYLLACHDALASFVSADCLCREERGPHMSLSDLLPKYSPPVPVPVDLLWIIKSLVAHEDLPSSIHSMQELQILHSQSTFFSKELKLHFSITFDFAVDDRSPFCLSTKLVPFSLLPRSGYFIFWCMSLFHCCFLLFIFAVFCR